MAPVEDFLTQKQTVSQDVMNNHMSTDTLLGLN